MKTQNGSGVSKEEMQERTAALCQLGENVAQLVRGGAKNESELLWRAVLEAFPMYFDAEHAERWNGFLDAVSADDVLKKKAQGFLRNTSYIFENSTPTWIVAHLLQTRICGASHEIEISCSSGSNNEIFELYTFIRALHDYVEHEDCQQLRNMNQDMVTFLMDIAIICSRYVEIAYWNATIELSKNVAFGYVDVVMRTCLALNEKIDALLDQERLADFIGQYPILDSGSQFTYFDRYLPINPKNMGLSAGQFWPRNFLFQFDRAVSYVDLCSKKIESRPFPEYLLSSIIGIDWSKPFFSSKESFFRFMGHMEWILDLCESNNTAKTFACSNRKWENWIRKLLSSEYVRSFNSVQITRLEKVLQGLWRRYSDHPSAGYAGDDFEALLIPYAYLLRGFSQWVPAHRLKGEEYMNMQTDQEEQRVQMQSEQDRNDKKFSELWSTLLNER